MRHAGPHFHGVPKILWHRYNGPTLVFSSEHAHCYIPIYGLGILQQSFHRLFIGLTFDLFKHILRDSPFVSSAVAVPFHCLRCCPVIWYPGVPYYWGCQITMTPLHLCSSEIINNVSLRFNVLSRASWCCWLCYTKGLAWLSMRSPSSLCSKELIPSS